MARGIASFIAGLGTGYMAQKDRIADRERQKKMDAMAEESHQLVMDKAGREQRKDRELEQAGADVTVTAGAGGATAPASADNRDVGQQDGPTIDNGQLTPGVRVVDQTFADPAAAQKAATEANTPAARAARQGAVLAKYDPAAAAQLRSATAQATLAEQQVADRKLRDTISGIKTWDGFADLINASPADNQGGQLKVKPVVSGDGKTVTFNKLNADGTEVPIPGSFSNDDKGMEQARLKVAGYMTPEMRMAHHQWQAQQDEHAKEFAATQTLQREQLAELGRNHQAMEKNAAALTAVHAATLEFQKTKARLDDPTFNLPPAVKLQTQALQKSVLSAQEQLAKAMAADPNFDENSKGAMALKGQIATANIQIGKLVQQYIPAPKAGATPAADPLGIRTPAAAPGGPAAKPAPTSPAAVAASTGVPVPANDDASYDSWVQSKLLGATDGAAKLEEIARTNGNPKIRAAAARLAIQYAAREQQAVPQPTGAAL